MLMHSSNVNIYSQRFLVFMHTLLKVHSYAPKFTYFTCIEGEGERLQILLKTWF